MSDHEPSIPLPERHQRVVRSYVVRTGRMTPAQRRALEEDWPNYRLRLADGRVQWEKVFARIAPVVLEIGFGMGDSLLAMAAADRATDFVGIEVHPPAPGVWPMARRRSGSPTCASISPMPSTCSTTAFPTPA